MAGSEVKQVAEAIDFDGTNDYLSRASDLTGNADGKTFTFSAWVWKNETGRSDPVYVSNFSGAIQGVVIRNNGLNIDVSCTNAANTVILEFSTGTAFNTTQTPLHLLCSIDLTNTARRHVYINDVLQTITWTTFTNDFIDFTRATHVIGGWASGSLYKGRLAHIYLDYTYRDLSVEANRRLFITADRKPAAGQASLNPILYLPLSDPTQPGKNLGTGGDFTLTGTIARSGRGPNQFNAPYSALSGGSSQYLSRATNLTGIADGKAFTFHCCFSTNNKTNQGSIFYILTSTTSRFFVRQSANGSFLIAGYNSSGTQILAAAAASTGVSAIENNRNFVLTASIDLSSASNRQIYVNGLAATVSWNIYTNDSIDFNVSSTPVIEVGRDATSNYLTGRLGNVFFDTKYIDLSQPANLQKFVTGTGIDAKPVDLGANGELPFGTAPLIYLPMYGNNAGKNYGTGGDFAVNSGPFTGARGPNEFWGNKAVYAGPMAGTPPYLYRTSSLSGASDGKTFSMSFFYNPTDFAYDHGIFFIGSGYSERLMVRFDAAKTLYINGWNSAGSQILTKSSGSALGAAGVTKHICLSIDMADLSKSRLYIDDVSKTLTNFAHTNDNIALSGSRQHVAAVSNGSTTTQYATGALTEFYFTTTYIDFSQEANRLKFRDAFGNPVDLAPQIEAGTLPTPQIYMRFDPSNFGKNLGTGGDFQAFGTITDGGQL